MIDKISRIFNNIYIHYAFLIFLGIIIYLFQLEKNFNLLPVYIIVLLFSLYSFFFSSNSKYLLPLFFVIGLVAIYQSLLVIFIILTIVYFLFILLAEYNITYKKIIFYTSILCLACIYLISSPFLEKFDIIAYVVGSLFMFRSIIYLYEIKNQKKPIDLIHRINYFLLLPNLSLPLFPIVDLKSFSSSYQKIDQKIVQRAILFIIRGIFQLLLYRFIYHFLIRSISDIDNLYDIFTYFIYNFLLVWRVIGAFHIALGMIMLTGYNVPDIFNNLFFATSFSDLWRRTNIYWKAFILKVYYYPIYFKIKKWGIYSSIFFATMSCFFITWLLHSYQWFWINGNFPFLIKDIVFWGIFGLLVSYNSINQQKELDNNEKINPSKFPLISNTIKSIGVFLTMSILWSIWISPSIQNWLNLIYTARFFDINILTKIALVIVVYFTISFTYQLYLSKKNTSFKLLVNHKNTLSIFFFILFIAPFIYFYESNLKLVNKLENALMYERLNRPDMKNIDNGYYSNLISTNNYTTQIWEDKNTNSKRWTRFTNTKLVRYTKNLLIGEYIPNTKIDFNGIQYSINSIGLHDKEYPLIKPSNTYRIVVLGGSHETGNSINDNEDFISLVENRINSNKISFNQNTYTEIINFSVNGYMPLQRYYQYKWKANQYKPDAILLFLHTNYRNRMGNYIFRLLKNASSIDDPYLNNLLKKNRINSLDNDEQIMNKMGNDMDSLIDYSIKSIYSLAKSENTKVVAVFLPTIKDKNIDIEYKYISNLCNKHQIELIDLSKIYVNTNKKELYISEVDFHPNNKANKIIAKHLYDSIVIHQNYFNFDTIK